MDKSFKVAICGIILAIYASICSLVMYHGNTYIPENKSDISIPAIHKLVYSYGVTYNKNSFYGDNNLVIGLQIYQADSVFYAKHYGVNGINITITDNPDSLIEENEIWMDNIHNTPIVPHKSLSPFQKFWIDAFAWNSLRDNRKYRADILVSTTNEEKCLSILNFKLYEFSSNNRTGCSNDSISAR